MYLVLFGLKLMGSLGIAIYFFYRDVLNISTPKAGVDVSNAALPVAIVFFMLQIGSILVFAVFLLVEAFRIKTVEVRARGCCPGAQPYASVLRMPFSCSTCCAPHSHSPPPR